MSARPWNRVYDDWKARHPGMDKVHRANYARACCMKLAHPDFLSAMLHAASLMREFAPKVLTIYHCEVCGKAHVGRSKHEQRIIWE